MPSRRIIHLDLDAFYCAVEEKLDPGLRDKPFAVGGRPGERGVVASCSYPARRKGVRSAMPTSQALRLCPDLLILPGHFHAYEEESRSVMERLKAVTHLVEQISIDEAFLDVTDIDRPAEQIARDLQAAIRADLGLPSSLGVAANKLVAKIASDTGKSMHTGDGPPNALTVVPEGTEAAFLAPLPVRALWGIGPKTEERLQAIGIRTIGDLAAAGGEALSRLFGKNGQEMARHAMGIDTSPIVTEREAKSFSQEVTFSRDVTDGRVLRREVYSQAERVSAMLREHGLSAFTIRIKIRWPDFTTHTRQMTLQQPTDAPAVIDGVAWKLVRKIWQPGRAVRLIGVGVSGLGSQPRQLNLWERLENENQ